MKRRLLHPAVRATTTAERRPRCGSAWAGDGQPEKAAAHGPGRRGLRVADVEVTALGRAARATPAGHLLFALQSGEERTAEFWETLSQVALWICGWISVAICLL